MIGVGVVGLGFGKNVHVPAFRTDPRFQVLALCGRDSAKTQAAAHDAGIPRAVAGIQKLLEDPSISAVALALPPTEQGEWLPRIISAGKHIFCEKPLAIPIRHGQEILAELKKKNLAHTIDFEFAEVPAWKKAKELIDQGALGTLKQIEVSWHIEIWAIRGKLNSWKTGLASGGGTLGAFASHTFYYLEWLCGPISKLLAHLDPEPAHAQQAEEAVSLNLEFQSGARGTASISARSFLGKGHRIAIYGSEGSLVLENLGKDYMTGFTLETGTRESNVMKPIDEVRWSATTQDGRIQAAASIIRRFGDWIESGKPTAPNLIHGFRVETLLELSRQSSKTEKWLSVGKDYLS